MRLQRQTKSNKAAATTIVPQVRQCMTTNVQACAPSDSLNRPAQLMWEHDCGCVPVVDEEQRVIGIITDRDICMAAYTQGRALADIQVQDAMARKIYACRPEDPISRAEAMMRDHQIRRLPVVDDQGILHGILSLRDIALQTEDLQSTAQYENSANELARTLAEICRPRTEASDGAMAS